MKQYLIYGTKRDWYYMQCPSLPVLFTADTKEEALGIITDKIFDTFKKAVFISNPAINLGHPKQSDSNYALKILTGFDFLTGDLSDDVDEIMITEDSGCILYDDSGFMSDHDNMESATTLVLGLMELSVNYNPDGTTSKTETVIPMSLEGDLLPLLMKRISGNPKS